MQLIGLPELLSALAGILALGLVLAASARFPQFAMAPPAVQAPAAHVSWIVALLCGAYLAIDAVFRAGFSEVGMAGVLLVGLALAVRRGEHSAAWILGALWLIVAALLVRSAAPPLAAAVALVLAGTSIRAGFVLRRDAPSMTTAEEWTRVLVEFAFLRAGWAFMRFARAVVSGQGPAIGRLIEVVVEGGLGVAAMKGRIWGAYGLVLVAVSDVVLAVWYRAPEEVTTRSLVLLVYGYVTYHIRTATVRGRRRSRMMEKLSGRGP
jgi:hypothetical protein